jgi:hypothetical protein
MMKKLVVFALLVMSVGSLGAIDIPIPDCLPCPDEIVSAR